MALFDRRDSSPDDMPGPNDHLYRFDSTEDSDFDSAGDAIVADDSGIDDIDDDGLEDPLTEALKDLAATMSGGLQPVGRQGDAPRAAQDEAPGPTAPTGPDDPLSDAGGPRRDDAPTQSTMVGEHERYGSDETPVDPAPEGSGRRSPLIAAARTFLDRNPQRREAFEQELREFATLDTDAKKTAAPKILNAAADIVGQVVTERQLRRAYRDGLFNRREDSTGGRLAATPEGPGTPGPDDHRSAGERPGVVPSGAERRSPLAAAAHDFLDRNPERREAFKGQLREFTTLDHDAKKTAAPAIWKAAADIVGQAAAERDLLPSHRETFPGPVAEPGQVPDVHPHLEQPWDGPTGSTDSASGGLAPEGVQGWDLLVGRFWTAMKELVLDMLLELAKEALLEMLLPGVHVLLPPTGLVDAIFTAGELLEMAGGRA